jgi:hypothetical protein
MRGAAPSVTANNSFQARPSVRLRLPLAGLNSNVRAYAGFS